MVEKVGRIKTDFIKSITKQILEKYKGKVKFTDDFVKNKEILDKIIEIESKKIKNQIAGYITKLVKSGKIAS